MITIRLNRVGVRRKPVYRIVVVESGVKKGGGNLDILGLWQPGAKIKKLDFEKLKVWVEKGAKVSRAVSQLIQE